MSTRQVKNLCEFWLSNNSGKSSFMFPVLPEQISITSEASNDTVTVSGLGEVTIIQDPAPKVFEFTSHFPAVVHQGVEPTIKKKPKLLLKPQEYIDMIEKWKASKKPVKFTVTDPNIGLFCSIESFSYYEQGGDPGTFYFTIKLKEYREVTVRKLDKTPATPPSTGGSGGSSGGSSGGTSGYKKGKVKTNGGRLMLRQKKSTSSKILAKMPNGSALTIKSKSGSWYAVIYKGKSGYAYAKYVKVIT